MEPNEAGDNNSEILRDIDDIIKVNASSLMPNDHLNFNLQQTSPHHPTLSEAAPSSTASSFYNPVHKDLPPSEKPYIRIIEQPTSKAFRFRYQCEGRSAGSIPGANSTNDRKTYPTIEIVGYSGEAAIVVSCVTKDEPYRPHPHNLVGKEGCKDGVFTMKLKSGALRVVFNNLGIQCARKKDIHASLSLRELQKVDPFKTKFSHKDNPSSIDLNAVRLCFQAFIKVDNERVALKPVVSDPIFKKPAELVITRLCSCSAKVGGGDEKILLCEKVLKEDIKVKFYEIENDVVKWEAFAYFNQVDVHKQTAIAFRTPRYHSAKVKDNSKVYIQLYRPSDGMTSEPKEFEFYPDPDELKRKRNRMPDANLNILRAKLQNREQTPTHQYSNDFNNFNLQNFEYDGQFYATGVKPEDVVLDADTDSNCSTANTLNTALDRSFMNILNSVSGTSGGTMRPLSGSDNIFPQRPADSLKQSTNHFNLNENIMPMDFASHLPSITSFNSLSTYTPMDEQSQQTQLHTLKTTLNADMTVQSNLYLNFQPNDNPPQTVNSNRNFFPWANVENNYRYIETSPVNYETNNLDQNEASNGNYPDIQGEILKPPEYTQLQNLNDDLTAPQEPTLSGLLATIDFDDLPLSNMSIHERTSSVGGNHNDLLRNSG